MLTVEQVRKVFRRWRIRVEFQPRDVWVGVYWVRKYEVGWSKLHVYVCVVPMLPIHYTIWRSEER